MNKIFEFTDANGIYDKCIYASIAHAIMVGKYTLLSGGISWNEKNYLFQNMEGIRGVISFLDNTIVCGIQDEENNIQGENDIENRLLKDAEVGIINIVKKEIFPYLLLETDNDSIPAVSAMFWGQNVNIYSNISEKDIMYKSDNILLPYLYKENDMKRYWSEYYEMSQEQEQLIEELFQNKKVNRSFSLSYLQMEKIKRWFGDKITYCKQCMDEIGITFN